MTSVSPRQNDGAPNVSFVVVPGFRHPSQAFRPLCWNRPLPKISYFSIFQGPPKQNRHFCFPVFAPLTSHSHILPGPPTQYLHFSSHCLPPYSWHFPGAVLGHLGPVLGPSSLRAGAILSLLRAAFRSSGGRLGAFLAEQTSASAPHVRNTTLHSWHFPGAVLGHLGPVFGPAVQKSSSEPHVRNIRPQHTSKPCARKKPHTHTSPRCRSLLCSNRLG